MITVETEGGEVVELSQKEIAERDDVLAVEFHNVPRDIQKSEGNGLFLGIKHQKWTGQCTNCGETIGIGIHRPVGKCTFCGEVIDVRCWDCDRKIMYENEKGGYCPICVQDVDNPDKRII